MSTLSPFPHSIQSSTAIPILFLLSPCKDSALSPPHQRLPGCCPRMLLAVCLSALRVLILTVHLLPFCWRLFSKTDVTMMYEKCIRASKCLKLLTNVKLFIIIVYVQERGRGGMRMHQHTEDNLGGVVGSPCYDVGSGD